MDRAEDPTPQASGHNGFPSERDNSFLESYEQMRASATRRGALRPAFVELVGVALFSSVTLLSEEPVARHIRAALAAGATPSEVAETLQLTSVLGIHTVTIGLPILAELLGWQSEAVPSPAQELLRDDFTARRGNWTPLWDLLLSHDEDFFRAYTDFSSAPWDGESALSAKERELIYVAIDASTTHLFVPGIRAHMQNAIGYGASEAELIELLEVVSLIGVRSYFIGTEALFAAVRDE